MPTLCLPAQDRRALHHFQNRTLQHIQGPFQDKTWSSIIPRMVEHDAIVRNAAFALSTLHEHYLMHTANQILVSEYSLHYYQKALQQIICLSTPSESFDSILGVCILACQFESLRGCFEDATRHAIAGVKIIADYQLKITGLTSGLSEDELGHLLLNLQYQVMDAGVDEIYSHTQPVIKQAVPVPLTFRVVEDALAYLDSLYTRSFSLYEKAELYYKTGDGNTSVIPPDLLGEYRFLCTDFELWSEALSRTGNSADGGACQKVPGFLALKIFEASMRLELDVFFRGEEAYDDFSLENFGILKLVETFLLCQGYDPVPNQTRSARPPPHFTASLGIVGLLFDIAIRTERIALRKEATRLLRTANRREGVCDSNVMAKVVDQIDELENRATAVKRSCDHNSKFVISEVKPLSEQEVRVAYALKERRVGQFYCYWFEDNPPDRYPVQSVLLKI